MQFNVGDFVILKHVKMGGFPFYIKDPADNEVRKMVNEEVVLARFVHGPNEMNRLYFDTNADANIYKRISDVTYDSLWLDVALFPGEGGHLLGIGLLLLMKA